MVDLLYAAFEQAEQDEALAQRVRHVLHILHVPALRRLDVEVEQGTVTLRGRLRTFYQRQMAVAAVGRIPGVRQVVSLVDVDHIVPAAQGLRPALCRSA